MNVRRVAAYVPVSRELLDDAAEIHRVLAGAWDDVRFALTVGRSRWTDVSAITMWRRWPQPLRHIANLRAVLRAER